MRAAKVDENQSEIVSFFRKIGCSVALMHTVGEPNDTNFVVGLAGGHEVFGKPEQYDAFIDKYLIWLESR